jgi:tricorn protease-like protein
MYRAIFRPLLTTALLTFTVSTGQFAPNAMAQETEREEKNADLPLEPGRSITIDTDEGTWTSVDVSSDGATIVFDMLGDLYLLPIAGGEARRLTSGMAFDRQPRFSPDGSKVLFVSDRSGADNLWTIEPATGDTAQLTKGKGHVYLSPEWSPDGQYIVASRANARLGPAQLWIGHVDGGWAS